MGKINHYFGRICCVCLLAFFFLNSGTPCFAGIDLPWSTTFDCPDWTSYAQPLDCDGLSKYLGGTSAEGHYEEILIGANNPSGGGGKGQFHWYGDGTNIGSGSTRVIFNTPVTELWIRWYMRYPLGFTWSGSTPSYDKLLLIFNDESFSRLRLAGPEIGLTSPTVSSTGNKGWTYINGGTTGDGQFHVYEAHIKHDGSNGVLDIWIDEEQVVAATNVIWPGTQFESIVFGSNQKSPANGGDVAISFDDIAIRTTGYIGPIGGAPAPSPGDTTPPVLSNISPSGSLPAGTTQTTLSLVTNENATCRYSTTAGTTYTSMPDTFSSTGGTSHSQLISGLLNGNSYIYYVRCQDTSSNTNSTDYSTSFSVSQTATTAIVLLSEDFEDTNFSSRGWYDNTSGQILDNTEYAPGIGSTRSGIYHFAQGATVPDSGGGVRRKFAASDEFYLEYFVKYSAGYQGSGLSYHPHEFFFHSDQDTDYNAPNYAYFQVKVEQTGLKPRIIFRDDKYVNTSYGTPPINLTGTTENRAVHGCNGEQDGYPTGCYYDGAWLNGKSFLHDSAVISDNTWHKIGVYIKLNTTSGSTTNADGIMQYWLDDNLIFNYADLVMRTSARPNIKLDKFVIAPYIGAGSPVDQTMWIDNLKISTTTSLPTTPTTPNIPGGFKFAQ